MNFSRCMQKTVAGIVAVAFCFVAVIVAPLQAAMVDTTDILQHQSGDLARQKVLSFMQRQDVSQQLSAWGVEPDEALARVSSMTDEEINLLAARIDQVPAGGDALGFLVALVLIAFIVLVITDIAGVTDVFTFIKKR